MDIGVKYNRIGSAPAGSYILLLPARLHYIRTDHCCRSRCRWKSAIEVSLQLFIRIFNPFDSIRFLRLNTLRPRHRLENIWQAVARGTGRCGVLHRVRTCVRLRLGAEHKRTPMVFTELIICCCGHSCVSLRRRLSIKVSAQLR